MTILFLIQMAERRLTFLTQTRETYVTIGDLAQVTALDADIAETETTLAALRTLTP